MMPDVDEDVKEYEQARPIHLRFTTGMNALLSTLLRPSQIRFIIEARTKDVHKFREKITRPDKNYSQPLKQVTDLTGLRIIVPTLSDQEKVLSIIDEEFDVDRQASVDSAERLKADQFGYNCPHKVVSLSASRRDLPEYRDFLGLKAEIQIRTILQHAWAVISRALNYPPRPDMPEKYKRQFARIAALLEEADDGFHRLLNNIKSLENEYKIALDKGDVQIEINEDSLKAYLANSDEPQRWIQYLRDTLGQRIEDWSDLSRDVRIAKFCGLKFVEEIDELLRDCHGWGEKFLADFFMRFFAENKLQPTKMATPLNTPASLLMIAAHADRFTVQTLRHDFGYRSTYMLEMANQAKRIFEA